MSVTFEGDRTIDEEVLREHKISADEYEKILAHLGRQPTFTELGVFSVMWSEHCSYKSSRAHLRRLPTEGPRVIQGPGENAGVVDIGDGFAAVFKIESHNHPSFIEPKQGAATGVGGILRDVFTMGARPIAALNSLRFGSIDHPRTRELVTGVVHGIGGYGNAFGVPTVGGEVQFDSRYDGNILVNAFTCGVVRTDRIFYGRAGGLGNPILYVGAKTGRDGIHGATMASDSFSENDGEGMATAKSIKRGVRSTVQVGDPFRGKLLLEACLELFEMDVLEGIQDMGAAGLTSSSVEMAGRSGTGVEIDLDDVPRRASHMAPYEILLSESQERMLMVAKAGKESAVFEICKKWDLDCAVIGRVTDTGRWVVKATPGFDPLARSPGKREPQVVCDLPVDALTDGAPRYERPQKENAPPLSTAVSRPNLSAADLAARALELIGTPNVGSKAWVYRQYDHLVRGGTALRPGSGASVVRVPCVRDENRIEKYLAFSVDGNGRFVDLDPRVGGAMVVAEVTRNLVVVGAEPIGLSDCLNFGNPEKPEVMFTIASAIDGIADACRALSVPIVSGNVSLYNETDGRPIFPTPTLAGVGQLTHERDLVTPTWKDEGDVVLLLGESAWSGLSGSEYAAHFAIAPTERPSIDLALEARLQALVLSLARKQLLKSASDVADGGLVTTLLEGSIVGGGPGRAKPLAIHGELPSSATPEAFLFGEAASRVIVSVAKGSVETVLELAQASFVPARRIGAITSSTELQMDLGVERLTIDVPAARAAHENAWARVTG